jgi:hypothetical protein
MTDLRAFARELVVDMERDLGTKLDWIGVDHYNTDNPHVHLLIRGKTEDGRDLVISRDYISRGIRDRGCAQLPSLCIASALFAAGAETPELKGYDACATGDLRASWGYIRDALRR